MKRYILIPTTLFMCGVLSAKSKPNLLIIQTDEQTFKSLGCYRDILEHDNAYPWGNYTVETPNIDRLAREGAICTNYYASCPVSTPSRASFQTGLYPVATDAPINEMAMNQNLTTFAQQLKDAGYYTSYLGKWHLCGYPSIDRPHFEPGYNFGYMNRAYMFEGGHWKWYEIMGEKNKVVAHYTLPKEEGDYIYSTDYLVDRTLEVLDESKDKTFCMMLSIPDPHSPDEAREPYLSEFMKNIDSIKAPATMVSFKNDSRPKWGRGGFQKDITEFSREAVANYFGTVKCLDDNVGRILDYLDKNNLTDNTILIFTSDHGDMLFEHSRINKGVPYESSARIPFLIRYPKGIKAGKVINNSYTTVDFTPTILGLMGVDQIPNTQGLDDSKAFLSDKKVENSDRIVYVTSQVARWTMATDGDYKLVLSVNDTPWLYDLTKDPDELVNLFSDPKYSEIAAKLQKELLLQMEKYNEPGLAYGCHFLLSADDKPRPNQPKYDLPLVGGKPQNAIQVMISRCMRPLD